MEWSDVGRKAIELGLPLLGGVLGGPAGAGVGKLVATAVTGNADASPSEVEQALATNPDAVVRLREIESNHSIELEKLALQGEATRLAHDERMFAEAAATQRAEIQSEDQYVRRARPTWVWVGAISVGLVVVTLCASIAGATLMVFGAVDKPETMAQVSAGVRILLDGGASLAGALMPIIMFVASVAGYYVKRRSDDKQIAAGHAPLPGIIGAFAKRLSGEAGG